MLWMGGKLLYGASSLLRTDSIPWRRYMSDAVALLTSYKNECHIKLMSRRLSPMRPPLRSASDFIAFYSLSPAQPQQGSKPSKQTSVGPGLQGVWFNSRSTHTRTLDNGGPVRS